MFFVCLFLFSKIFMSKYNIYIYIFLKANESYETRMEKKCRKVKKKERYRGPGRYVTIFPPFLCLIHFSTARLRLGHDLGVVLGLKIPKKMVRRENRAKTASFWPVFFFKGTGSKTTPFGPF